MKKIISICGNICSVCAAYIATNENSEVKRKETAKLWSKMYSSDISPEDIYCEGCMTEGGKKFNYCKVCEIRKCGMEKGVKNCAYCGEYICDKLEEVFKRGPKNKDTLDRIKEIEV